MYIAKNLTSKSLPEIGKNFGGRDHATVIYAVKKVRELMIANPRLENLIKETEQICSNL
jgi:chromosomal replication initiator protein